MFIQTCKCTRKAFTGESDNITSLFYVTFITCGLRACVCMCVFVWTTFTASNFHFIWFLFVKHLKLLLWSIHWYRNKYSWRWAYNLFGFFMRNPIIHILRTNLPLYGHKFIKELEKDALKFHVNGIFWILQFLFNLSVERLHGSS